MNRRHLMLAGVAAAAGAAGLGSAWWRTRRASTTEGIAGADESFWAQRFDAPDGGEVVLAEFRGRPLLLNFWATWCPPCVTEMPLLDRFHAEHRSRGWQVVGLAVDSPTPVREFLVRHPIGFRIGLAGLGGTDLSRTLGNSAGALPFSVVFDRSGQAIERKLGTVSPEDLQRWVEAVG